MQIRVESRATTEHAGEGGVQGHHRAAGESGEQGNHRACR